MSTKSKGPKWDGISRVSNDLYRKNFEEIFNKKGGVVNTEESFISKEYNKNEEDKRGPNDLERIIDQLKNKVKRLEDEKNN